MSRKSYLKNKVKRKKAEQKASTSTQRKYIWGANWEKGLIKGLFTTAVLWLYKIMHGKEYYGGK